MGTAVTVKITWNILSWSTEMSANRNFMGKKTSYYLSSTTDYKKQKDLTQFIP